MLHTGCVRQLIINNLFGQLMSHVVSFSCSFKIYFEWAKKADDFVLTNLSEAKISIFFISVNFFMKIFYRHVESFFDHNLSRNLCLIFKFNIFKTLVLKSLFGYSMNHRWFFVILLIIYNRTKLAHRENHTVGKRS